MLVVEIGSIITTYITVHNAFTGQIYSLALQVSIWLWFTVLFANFAEALAEIKGKARAESLRSTKKPAYGNTAKQRLQRGKSQLCSAQKK